MPKFDSLRKLPDIDEQVAELLRDHLDDRLGLGDTLLRKKVSYDKIWNICRDTNNDLRKIGFEL